MKEIQSNWNTLPVEILTQTFQPADPKELCTFAIVCKAWTYPAQADLYSSITIHSLKQLKKFSNTVEHNSQLGNNVKLLDLRIYVPAGHSKTTGVELCNVLTDLLSKYLPKLEKLENYYRPISYLPVLNALLDSQLKHLKSLGKSPDRWDKGEVANYTTCALLMRDRLESLLISEEFEFATGASNEELYFDCLYNKLHQFDKLKNTVIYKDTKDEIQILDHVVETCKSLKKITFNFCPSDDERDQLSLNDTTSISAISNFIPRCGIKSLDGVVLASNYSKVLSYIMHKFPQLLDLCLSINEDSITHLDRRAISQLFHYLPKLVNFSAYGLRVEESTALHNIGSYWDATSKLGGERIEIVYEENPLRIQHCTLQISKSVGVTKINVRFALPDLGQINWSHINLIETYGKYLGELEFVFPMSENERGDLEFYELPGNFLAHTLAHCQHLRTLRIESAILRRNTYFTVDLRKKVSLSELFISNCAIYAGALEQWSLLLPKIEKLGVGYRVEYRQNSEDQHSELNIPVNQAIEIIMPYTKIGLLFLEQHDEKPLYLKIFAMPEEKYYYYYSDIQLDETDEWLKVLSEEEYLAANDHKHIYVCCQTKPDLHFDI